ncbi:hypothetical protein V6N13_064535 [Hibiscus sabdariffa]
MAFLQKTKLEVISANLVRKVWLSDTFEFLLCPATGRSGAILVVWERGSFIMEESCIGGRLFGSKDDGYMRLGRVGCLVGMPCAMWRDMLQYGMILGWWCKTGRDPGSLLGISTRFTRWRSDKDEVESNTFPKGFLDGVLSYKNVWPHDPKRENIIS